MFPRRIVERPVFDLFDSYAASIFFRHQALEHSLDERALESAQMLSNGPIRRGRLSNEFPG